MDTLAQKMATIEWTYGDKDAVARAILEQRIVDAGRRLSIITYSDLVKGVQFRLPNVKEGQPFSVTTYDWSGLDRRIVGDFLGYSSYRSYVNHGFMMSALVVNKDEFRPSYHFFEWMRQLDVLPDVEEDTVLKFWVEQMNKAHNWYKAGRKR